MKKNILSCFLIERSAFGKYGAMFLFLLYLCNLSLAQDPDGPHPRIFLNPSKIAELNQKIINDVPEWQQFEEYLDQFLVEDPWGDQYIDGIAAFALAYQVTANTVYADRALEFLMWWVVESYEMDPYEASQDAYSHLWEMIGLGYDWLYNYPEFTISKKDSVIEMMNRAFHYGLTGWEHGGGEFEGDSHDSDQFTGDAKTDRIWGIATFGDNTEADSLLDHANTLWQNHVKGWILNSIGGIWPEGSQYSYQTLYFLLALTESERTALGLDVWSTDTQLQAFIKNCIQGTIWLTPPSNDHIVVYYDQEDVNEHYWNRRTDCVALLGSLAEVLGYTEAAAYSRYWIRDVCQDISYELNLWKLFLWYDSQAQHTNYFQQQLPGAHFVEGQDWMFLRTHWANQGTYSTFYAPWTNVDHQFSDGGHFNIWRNGEYLSRLVRHYDFFYYIGGKAQILDGEASNVLLIKSDFEEDEDTNAAGSAELFESSGEPSISRYKISEAPLYYFAEADLGESYNRIYDEWGGNSDRVDFYKRCFVHIAPDYFFVYDKVFTSDPGWVKFVLHSHTEPSISGNTITQISESGTQKLFQKTLFPSTVTINKVDESILWSVANGMEDWMINDEEKGWHTEVMPQVATEVRMLHLLEAADIAASGLSDHSLIDVAKALGAQIENWVVLFAKDTIPMDTIVFDVTNHASGIIESLVCNVKPISVFDVLVNDVPQNPVSSGKDGVIHLEISTPFASYSPRQTTEIKVMLKQDLPAVLSVLDTIIESASINCFNAFDSLFVAGNGSSVVVENNATASFISKDYIMVKDGFHALGGSSVRIYLDDTFCEDLYPVTSSGIGEDNRNGDNDNTINPELEGKVMIYPNPTNGMITMKISKYFSKQPVFFDLYDCFGRRIISDKEINTSEMEFDISIFGNGLFLIVLRSETSTITRKILKM